MSKFGILIDTENTQFSLRCSIDALLFLHELLEEDLAAAEKNGGRASIGYLRRLADAMYSVILSIYNSNQELKEAVDEEYEKRKKGTE